MRQLQQLHSITPSLRIPFPLSFHSPTSFPSLFWDSRHSNSLLSLIQYVFPWLLPRHRVLLVCLVLNVCWMVYISLEKSLVNFISEFLTKLLFHFAFEFIVPYCIFIVQFLQLCGLQTFPLLICSVASSLFHCIFYMEAFWLEEIQFAFIFCVLKPNRNIIAQTNFNKLCLFFYLHLLRLFVL